MFALEKQTLNTDGTDMTLTSTCLCIVDPYVCTCHTYIHRGKGQTTQMFQDKQSFANVDREKTKK